ncbi:hypothetical protein [Streptomyces antibioticus]|uniref:hypothetical protein n=1 Tax=Streptomyces antibioticus TaxID=1890 RepID=UPI0033A562AC
MRRLKSLFERRKNEIRIGPLAVGWFAPSDRDKSRGAYIRIHTVILDASWVPDIKSRWLWW